MKKTLFPLALAALLMAPASRAMAADAAPVTGVLVQDASNHALTFYFSEQPVITPGDGIISVAVGQETYEFAMADVTIIPVTTTPTAIVGVASEGVAAAEPALRQHAGTAVMSGVQAGETVALYDVNGRQVASAVASADGSVALSLVQLPAGIYIVKAQKASIKFIKK